MDELIKRARAGCGRSLEKLITDICEVPTEDGHSTMLWVWASERASYLREWDADDIVARMHEWIWRLVMDVTKHPKLTFPSLKQLAWRKLRQVVITQATREKTLKRTGITVDIDEVFGSPSLRTALDTNRIHFYRDIELLMPKLTNIQKFIVIQILYHNRSLADIAALLQAQHPGDKWYTEKVRQHVAGIKNKFGTGKRVFENGTPI